MISEQEVLKIAKLAKLSIKPEEIKLFVEQLGDILTYIDLLNALDTTDVIPTSRPIPTNNIFRADIVKAGLTNEEIFQNAPAKENNMFKVPKI